MDYEALQNIDHEPAFNWWENHLLRRRDRVISKAKHRGAKKYVKMTMEFGIELTKTVHETMTPEKKNGNTLWAEAVAKYMSSI